MTKNFITLAEINEHIFPANITESAMGSLMESFGYSPLKHDRPEPCDLYFNKDVFEAVQTIQKVLVEFKMVLKSRG